MKDFVLLTGNQGKADQLAQWLGHPVEHHKLDLDEIQSLDSRAITEHKVRQAYALLQRPVVVEDVSFVFEAMGHLPGPLIKWFLEDLGLDGLCKLVDGLAHRQATVSVTYAYFDGHTVSFFDHSVHGQVAPAPKGEHGFGWNPIFIPDGSAKTYSEMGDPEELRRFSMRAGAIDSLRAFLESDA